MLRKERLRRKTELRHSLFFIGVIRLPDASGLLSRRWIIIAVLWWRGEGRAGVISVELNHAYAGASVVSAQIVGKCQWVYDYFSGL